jgi:hypothetical protein
VYYEDNSFKISWKRLSLGWHIIWFKIPLLSNKIKFNLKKNIQYIQLQIVQLNYTLSLSQVNCIFQLNNCNFSTLNPMNLMVVNDLKDGLLLLLLLWLW